MKVVVFGDLHYPEVSDKEIEPIRDTFYEHFFQKLFEIDAEYYISIGDLTNYGTDREIKGVYDIINKHGKKFIHVLGNHDVYGNSKNNVIEQTGQKRYHAIDTKHAIFAFIDTTRDQDLENWGGIIDNEQLEWLTDIVNNNDAKPLIIFGHHPVYQTTAFSDKDMFSIDPSIPIWELLQKRKTKGIYINGHNHYNSITDKEQWTFVQLAAILDQPAVRILDIDDVNISINTISFLDDKMKEQAQLIGENIQHFTLKSNELGTTEDLSHTIKLDSKPQSV